MHDDVTGGASWWSRPGESAAPPTPLPPFVLPPFPVAAPRRRLRDRVSARTTARTTALVGVVIAVLVAGGIGGYVGARVNGAGDVVIGGGHTTGGTDAAQQAPSSTAAIAKRVLPSVVSINVDTDRFEDSGPGFVISADGDILTNNHVVRAAVDGGGVITVVFAGGRSARAKLVGHDPASDIAVVRVSGVGDLQPVTFGDSDAVAVGDTVVAIGSPLGLAGTVTSGIVSAVHRPVSPGGDDASDDTFIDAIQTDAAINPGNSGGPLVDAAGHVIGVNSAIATPPGTDRGEAGSIGLGFAIPIKQAARVSAEIIATGKATHAVVGVAIDTLYVGGGAKVLADRSGHPGVAPGGPAAAAGLRAGDVIVGFDGQPITTATELLVAIRSHAPGDRVSITYERDGAEHTVKLTLGASSD